MPISSVFQVVSEDPEQIESLVTTLNGYVTTTAASETAAATSETNAAASETNAAASAAAALVSKNAAANSAASTALDAASATTSATNAATSATTASGHATSTAADAVQTAADRVQTGLDRIATAADAVSTAADAVSTAADAASASSDASAAASSAAAALVSQNAASTSETNAAASATSAAADAASTAADATSTAADAVATAADRVQTGLDVTSSSTNATNAATSATAAAASQVSAAASAASAAAVFNDFEDRYYGPHASDSAAQTHVTGLGLTVDQGDLYFNSTANEMRVYDGGSWIAASSAGGASLINYNYTATASQTAFSGSDDNSNTLSYTVDNLIVTRNGVVLEDGTDYTATDGSTITLTVAATAGDEINVVAFKSFTTADMVSATNGGTFQSNVTVNGTMTATAFSGDGSALTGITIPTLSSLGIANHDQVTVTAGGAVTATSFSGDGSALTGIPTPTLTSLGIANHDQLTVDGSGNLDVTGTVTADGLTVDGSFRQTGATAPFEWTVNAGATDYYKLNSVGYSDNIIIATAAGNVGIGTVPAQPLHVVGGAVQFENTQSTYLQINTGDTHLYTAGSHPLRFGTNGIERLAINADGNVGVGSAGIPASSGAAGRYFDTYNLGTDSVSFAINRLVTNNVAGTGTSSADIYKRKNGQFTIANNETDAAAYMNFQVGTQSHIHISNTGSGSVGVGTQTPVGESKLTVAGQSLSITGADVNFNGGGVRGMLDLASGYLRMGAVNGGGAANGIKLIAPFGGEAVVVDSSGRVTKPYQPSWNARSYGHNTASTGFTRVGSTDNSGSIAFTTQVGNGLNNGRFTAPVAGTYWVHVNASDSYGGNAGLQIWKNGSSNLSSTAYIYGVSYNGTGLSAAVYLNANEYVEGMFYHFNGVNSQLYDGSFSGFLIG